MRNVLRRGRFLLLALLISAVILPGAAMAQVQKPDASKKDERPSFKPRALKDKEAVPDQIIVKFKKDASSSVRASARRDTGLEKKKDLDLIDAEVDKVKGQSAERAVQALERRSDVEYAELDYINHPFGYTDEPQFGQLWGLDNTGQTINGSLGTADVDVNAKEASAVTQGDQNLVVAVIDDGVDFSHPDLEDRAWKNPGESGSGKETNGVDDDGNGLVDDVNGWDFYYDDKTVHDPGEDFHGTHVSGTIAASVNGQGVVGVAPNVQIMALKFLGPQGGSNSDAIDALGYAKSKGAKISNNSWGCTPGFCFSQALKDAIEASGLLFVAAAGNNANNNDVTPAYPASYDSPNILSVAAINNQGKLAGFSNFGATSVDISAPGVSILSSIPGVPDTPAAALSSVGSSGKAVTAGFGADEISDSAKQASFMSKAFTAVNRGSQQVVLVDDDADDSWLGFPDVGPTLSGAIESATGSVPEVIDVPYRSDGPALSQLTGKTVVWATGQAFLSDDDGFFITKTTLTNADQQTLTNFLNGGGKLVLTGMDALFLIEGSSFVTNTLKLNPQSNVPDKTAFNGSSGTAFAGESYNLNSSTANPDSHDVLTPADSAAVTQGVYPGAPSSWQYFDGTSMATPHATGVAALAASKSPSLLSDPTGLKQAIMDGGKPVSATSGKTVTGDMVDAMANLAPRVTDVFPKENATNVPRTTNVTATFSEDMDPTSFISGTTIKLVKAGTSTSVPATVNCDNPCRTITLDPNADLEEGATYTATVTTGAKNAAGDTLAAEKNWTFTVDAAPTVSGTTPTAGATGVRRATNITVTFSEAMDTTTFNNDTVKLVRNGTTPTAIPFTMTTSTDSSGRTVLTLDPFGPTTQKLARSKTYTVTIEGGGDADSLAVKDLAGNEMAQDKVWSFTTGRK